LIALATLSAAAVPAAATSYDLGLISPGGGGQGGNFWFGATAHSDDYSFQIADLDTGSLSFSRLNIGLADFTGSLYRGGSLIQSFGVLADGTDTTLLGGLGGGSYNLVVSGTPVADPYGLGPLGGYSLALTSAAATPAPGPAGWLVAVAGVAVVGFAYRRRMTKVTVSA
jgi:hypothetical protein